MVSYLTARPSSDQIRNSWQAVTQQWWTTKLDSVTACISPFVIQEIQGGDANAAKERIDAVRALPVLETNADIEAIADYLLLGRSSAKGTAGCASYRLCSFSFSQYLADLEL